MFHAWLVKIAKIAAHSAPATRVGNNAMKNVTVNEPFFQGHFPEFPVMPGVMIVEAMAQTAGILVLRGIPDRDNKLVFLVSVDAARFRKPVVPGDQLRSEMKVIRRKGTVAKMAGTATVNGVLVAEAEVMCKLEDKVPFAAAPQQLS